MIPLYGFLEGDTIGLLILAEEQETLGMLAEKLQRSAAVRALSHPRVRVEIAGLRRNLSTKVAEAGLKALDRFDVRRSF
jgi:hypothetical protein